MLIQAQLHLCLRKVHPSIRHRPSWQHVCRKRHPHNVQLLANLQRLSFARPLCNHPFNKPLHPPEPSAPPPSSPSSGEGRGTNQTTCTRAEAYEHEKNPISPSERSSIFPYSSTSLARGAVHIKRDIAIQTNIPCISDKWSLLSILSRGGMSRSDRVVSLLRRMIASEDAKTH